MSLNIAIQMDPIESIIIARDSTYLLGLAAQNRGHKLYYYQPYQLTLEDGEIFADLTELQLSSDESNYYSLGQTKKTKMSKMDIVMMRQDPPFDMNYITYTYLLEMLMPKTLVINNPAEVRNCPEKLFVCKFSQYMAPTIVTADKKQMAEFFDYHKDIVVKTLYSFSGNDVFHVSSWTDLHEKYEILQQKYNAPIMLQKFLPNIKNGDKRIILIDGEIAGRLIRIPKEDQFLCNMLQGGTAIQTPITSKDEEICGAIGQELKRRGLILAGIDLIDGYITEINVTCPTGLKVINGLYNIHMEDRFWDVVEAKIYSKLR